MHPRRSYSVRNTMRPHYSLVRGKAWSKAYALFQLKTTPTRHLARAARQYPEFPIRYAPKASQMRRLDVHGQVIQQQTKRQKC